MERHQLISTQAWLASLHLMYSEQSLMEGFSCLAEWVDREIGIHRRNAEVGDACSGFKRVAEHLTHKGPFLI